MHQGAEGEFRSNLHRGGTSVPVELSVKERNIAIKAARTLGLSIAGVDIIRSARGPLILEVNSSPFRASNVLSVQTWPKALLITSYSNLVAVSRKDKIGA